MRILPDAANYRRLQLISLCVLSVIISGCGQKIFPTPQGCPPPPQAKDLRVKIMPKAVELSWTPAAVDPAKHMAYAIMRADLKWDIRTCLECPSADMQKVGSIDAATRPGADGRIRWIDTTVCSRQAYRYQVAMLDERGSVVSVSNQATAIVYPAPAAPVDITATPQQNGILVGWKPVFKDIEGGSLDPASVSFQVERRSSEEKGWEKASPALVKASPYLDQTIASDLTYSYRVVAVLFIDNTYIYGEPSGSVLAKARGAVPPPPPQKVWVTPAHGGLDINWSETDGKTAGYHVYRKDEGGEMVRLTASPVQHPPFLDKGVKKGATYSYAVSAVSAQADHKEGLLSKWVEIRNLISE
jgi:hypothetical protein